MKIDRRELLKNAGLASGAAWFGAACGSGKFLSTQDPSPTSAVLPNPVDSGIDHLVVVTMENRSFDHFMGWLPNADGKQAGLTFVDNSGVSHSTIEWRWGLAPLTPRDASSDISNLASALNFASPDATVPSLPVPQTPLTAAPCLQNLGGGILSSGGSSSPATEWQQLSQAAASLGFPAS